MSGKCGAKTFREYFVFDNGGKELSLYHPSKNSHGGECILQESGVL